MLQVPFLDDAILRYTPADLQSRFSIAAFREAFRKEIDRSAERLLLAEAERNADVPFRWDQRLGKWIHIPQDQIPAEKRWMRSPGGAEYGWIPLRYFPGGCAPGDCPELR
jgi:hypothetical protein